MSAHHGLKRFIRSSSRPDHLSEEQRERIAARRIAKFSGLSKGNEHRYLTPEQVEARNLARITALLRRQSRG
jgi:hypothetical protein